MGNNSFKRVLSIVLAATCMLVFSFSMTFASESSPKVGDKYSGDKNGEYKITSVSSNTAALIGVWKSKQKKIKTKTIPQTSAFGGKNYTNTSIAAKAFKNCKKLRKVKIKSTKLTKVAKSAFKGCKKSKIKVYVTKKMSKKNYKKLVKALKKAGIKKKNIKRF